MATVHLKMWNPIKTRTLHLEVLRGVPGINPQSLHMKLLVFKRPLVHIRYDSGDGQSLAHIQMSTPVYMRLG